MDMTENDDKLIAAFFEENRREIADNGFSKRVMHHLPDRTSRLSHLWTVFCCLLGAGLFIWLDGIRMIWYLLREMAARNALWQETLEGNALQTIDSIDLKNLLIVGVVLVFLAGHRLVKVVRDSL